MHYPVVHVAYALHVLYVCVCNLCSIHRKTMFRVLRSNSILYAYEYTSLTPNIKHMHTFPGKYLL